MSEVIKQIQRKLKLKDDGKIGPITAKAIADELNIKTAEHFAHFMGQVHHETGGFKPGRESLNYSVKALLTSFGRHRISESDAKKFGRGSEEKPANQQAIANAIYGGEWGNKNLGNVEPMDGWVFRGNGSIQLTGRGNHQAFANFVKDQEIMKNSDLVNQKYYFESGIFFFNRNNIWRFCDKVDSPSILTVSRAVNIGNPNSSGTPKGMEDRIKQTNHYFNLVKDILK
jgi:putative chitinase